MKIINKICGITMSIILISTMVKAGTYTRDTVVLKFKNNVDIVVVSESEEDMESALSYDLNEVFKDLKYKVRMSDDNTLTLVVDDEFGDRYLKDTTIVLKSRIVEDNNNDEYYEQRRKEREKYYRKRTRNYYNIDFGMNNYLQDGKFPDESNALYTVRPWGSWYIGTFALFKTNIAGPLNIEWGGGIDWYSFKFENGQIKNVGNDEQAEFLISASENIWRAVLSSSWE